MTRRTIFALIFYLLLSTVHCPLSTIQADAAPVLPSVADRYLADGHAVPACPSSIGDLAARLQARRAQQAQGGFLSPNQTFQTDTDSVTDTVNVAVLLVQFQVDASSLTGDSGMFPEFASNNAGDTASVAGRARTFMDRLDTFYTAVSYGRLRVTSTVFGDSLVTAASQQTTYMNDASSPTGLDDLVEEVCGKVDTTSIDFGAFDVVIVFHAGPSQQLGLGTRDIPSLFMGPSENLSYTDAQSGTTVTHAILCFLDGAVISGDTISGFGTLAHEFGHALGLPDLYETDGGGASGAGFWALMGTGNYNGVPQGDSPSWHDAWSREMLHWADTVVIDTLSQAITMTRAEDSLTIYKIFPDTAVKTEYFLIEVRIPTQLDSVPHPGLLIWHVDNTIGSFANNDVNNANANTKASHDRVHLEAADGNWNVTISGRGDAGDPWPGNGSKTEFGDNSTPSSRNYADSTARFALKSISLGSTTATFSVDFENVTVSVAGTIQFPGTCAIGRLFSGSPRMLAILRDARDRMLSHSIGRRIVLTVLSS